MDSGVEEEEKTRFECAHLVTSANGDGNKTLGMN